MKSFSPFSLHHNWYWEKLGRILTPTASVNWMCTYTSAAFAQQVNHTPFFDIYVTGRNQHNQSQIGCVRIDIRQPNRIISHTQKAILGLGQLGAFDENGVSYPYLVQHAGHSYLYYVGWMPTVCTPFNLQLGLAKQQSNGTWQRYSPAPILPRNKHDYLSTGSCCVLFDEVEQLFKMWYTSFIKWGKTTQEHKHHYHIKYAVSKNGIHWMRDNITCISFANQQEYAICRPSVIKVQNTYHMWFAYRGKQYKIGYASSDDGINWQRNDAKAGINTSPTSTWDNEAVCYPHVFNYGKQYYLLYNGNNYGKTGLGLAILRQA